MTDHINEYFEALQRLIDNKPMHIIKGGRISNSTVAKEAGRDPSAIKKNRPVFQELISAIKVAGEKQGSKGASAASRLTKAQAEAGRYRNLYEAALARELMLIKKLYDLETGCPEPVTNIENNPLKLSSRR